MKPKNQRREGKTAFDLLEEATHRLRTAPAGTLAMYYLGAIPFVLGLLFFWADMSRSPLAPQHLASASFGMAGLFVWMKFWQTIFARSIRAQAAGEPYALPGLRTAFRIFVTQAIIHPFALIVLPLSLVPMLPFAWVYALFQNVTALDEGGADGAVKILKASWRQAKLWPRQNHILLTITFVLAFCVFLNWLTACFAVPELLKMLFGIETEFSRNSFALLNTTTLAAITALTYLCVDPIVKTAYVLRCFYGESLESGADIRAELKPFAQPALKAVVLLGVWLALFAGPAVRAETTNAPVTVGASVPPADLDHAINQTIHERKYLWRMPRDKVIEPDADANEGVIAKFFDKVGAMIRDWMKTISHWLEKIWDKLFGHRTISHDSSYSPGYGWILGLQYLLYGLVAVVLCALAIFLLRLWQKRRRSPVVAASEAIQPVPDITDENVRADQLPEDGWTKLARELLERGEFRLAMRAFYLASLAHLAARNLVSIAKFKSNRDYERELRRRAHSFPALLSVFGDNLAIFERIWYGTHSVDGLLVREFAANVDRMKGGG